MAAVPACWAALSLVAWRQEIGYWRKQLRIRGGHALAATSNNFVAEDQFGGALVQAGRVDEAYPHFCASGAAASRPTRSFTHEYRLLSLPARASG